MRTHRKILAALILASGIAGMAHAADDEVLLDAGEKTVSNAQVEYIDVDNRDLKLSLPDGALLEFQRIDPKITQFDKLQINDIVKISASQQAKLVLLKGGAGIRSVEEDSGRTVADNGVALIKTRTATSDILGVDRNGKSVKIKTPSGEILNIPVNSDAILAKATTGDQVRIITEGTMAIWGQ